MGLGPADFERRVQRAEPVSVEAFPTGKSGALDARWKDGTRAVLKLPRDRLPNGKEFQRELPVCSHPQREVAFYRLAEVFGYDYFVPKTVLVSYCGEKASAQAYVNSKHLNCFSAKLDSEDAVEWTEGLREAATYVSRLDWLRLVLLDLVAGARDRHSNNVGVAADPKKKPSGRSQLVAFDNAVTFGRTFRYYHEVFHKFLFRSEIDLDPAWGSFTSVRESDFRDAISGLVSPVEVDHAWIRYRYAIEFPYRLPWEKISCGEDAPRDFPPREKLFGDVPQKKIDQLDPAVFVAL